MAFDSDFPSSPYEILDPEIRWFPGPEAFRKQLYGQLIPPLVAKIRENVKIWRDTDYEGASNTSKALLSYWFETEHPIPSNDGSIYYFKYYFAQREAVETVIYLHEIAKVKDKYDLLQYDSSGAVRESMFDETWRRFVIKMATGSGKTKVLSLILAWSYFHKLYEKDSTLARNFLVVTPNIIVLDRIFSDFDGLRIFYEDPVLPENGYEEQNWQDDFQLTLHIQDNVNMINKTGNIFLTNIHRVYASNKNPPLFKDEDTSDYFLGEQAIKSTTDSKLDLGDIVRDIDELAILNDEAHHIHEKGLAWFKSLEDIHNRLLQKGSTLSIQVDFTATPKHENGSIFVQTICDYPLVEAIHQNIVKHPILPDKASRAKLKEKKTSKYSERYDDYLELGYQEWKKTYEEHKKVDKKAVLFVMTDDTTNCDEVAEHLENRYQDLKNSVLVIHTKKNGRISETSASRNKDELEELRKAANTIDLPGNRYKAIVSVLVLKEGWDVKNVTTIVGLRAYTSKGNILPEQTLGRGLRLMYHDLNIEEEVSVVGTDAFMDFVESIKKEGVKLGTKPMGPGTEPKAPTVIEIDYKNPKKDLEELNIKIPILTPRIYREYGNLDIIDVSLFDHKKIEIKPFDLEDTRKIVFEDIVSNKPKHTTELDSVDSINYQGMIGFFTLDIMEQLRLVSGYDALYGKVKQFIKYHLFENQIDLEDPNILKNISQQEPTKIIIESFKKKINEITILDRGNAEIISYINTIETRPFISKKSDYFIPEKSVFNKIIGDSYLELEFASFLDNCDDIVSFIKNDVHTHFKIDYINSKNEIRNYYPDFIVKISENELYIIETKGAEYLDDPLKIKRLKQWCEDVNQIQSNIVCNFLYVDEKGFHKYHPNNFKDLKETFKQSGEDVIKREVIKDYEDDSNTYEPDQTTF